MQSAVVTLPSGLEQKSSETRAVTLADSLPGLLDEHRQGRINAYWDVLTHSRR